MARPRTGLEPVRGKAHGGRQDPSRGASRKLAEDVDEDTQRALRRMEMGPNGMGTDDPSDEEPAPLRPYEPVANRKPQRALSAGKAAPPAAKRQRIPPTGPPQAPPSPAQEEERSGDDVSTPGTEDGVGSDEPEQAQGSQSESDREQGSGGDGLESEQDAAEQALQQQLEHVPFEARLELLRDGGGPVGKVAIEMSRVARERERSFKRVNKHRPQELSSKRPVSRHKEVVAPARREGRDPRFAATARRSDADTEVAAKRYAFLYTDVLPKEKAALKAALKGQQRPGPRARLSAQLQRVEQAMGRESSRRARTEVERSFKDKQKKAQNSGDGGDSKPFFLKSSDKKKLALVAKYDQLKSKGKLDRYMEQRRKRNASKDHKHIPGQRGDAGEE